MPVRAGRPLAELAKARGLATSSDLATGFCEGSVSENTIFLNSIFDCRI
jgi:hypothetical protein